MVSASAWIVRLELRTAVADTGVPAVIVVGLRVSELTVTVAWPPPRLAHASLLAAAWTTTTVAAAAAACLRLSLGRPGRGWTCLPGEWRI
jgi:hypothetical protein